jgi:Na+/proline symporter
MAGGMWAISITDFVQSIIIISGLIAISWSVTGTAGSSRYILDHAPEHMFRFFPDTGVSEWIHWLAAWMVLGLGSIPSQDIFQRMNAARSERVAMASTLSGALIYLLFSMLPLYLALAAKVLYAREITGIDTQHILPIMALKHTSIYVQVLFFGALLSAIFSTCSGAILAPASIISENIIRPYLKKDLDDKKFLRILRISVVLIATIATLMALSSNNIYELVAESSILGLVTLLVPMFCAIYWKPASSFGALLSMISGFTVWFIFEHVIEINFPSLMAGFMASVAGMVLGSFYRKSLKKNHSDVRAKQS